MSMNETFRFISAHSRFSALLWARATWKRKAAEVVAVTPTEPESVQLISAIGIRMARWGMRTRAQELLKDLLNEDARQRALDALNEV
jgi:hypothetical protein